MAEKYLTVVLAVHLLCLMLCATAGEAPGRQVLNGQAKKEVDPKCFQGLLQDVIPLSTYDSISLNWTLHEPNHECTKDGAKYIIIVSFDDVLGNPYEKEVPMNEKGCVISPLNHSTTVSIRVSLLYTDENGGRHSSNTTTLSISTKYYVPSKPKTLNISLMLEGAPTAVLESPDLTTAALEVYRYSVCDVDSCRKGPLRTCGNPQETGQPLFTINPIVPLQYYWVWLEGYNSTDRQEKDITDIAPLCFRAPQYFGTDAVRDIKTQCTSSPNRITVSWRHPDGAQTPDGYLILLNGTEVETHRYEKKTLCHGQDCKTSFKALQGAIKYHFRLFPCYKDIVSAGNVIGAGECVVPESALPPPKSGIKVGNSSQLNQVIEFPKEIFSEANGALTDIILLVAPDWLIDDCARLTTWNGNPIRCYSLVVKAKNDSTGICEEHSEIVRCTLGTRANCKDTYSCGPHRQSVPVDPTKTLKGGVRYGVKLRAYNSAGYAETKPVFFTMPSSVPGRRIDGVLLAGVAIAVIVFSKRG